MDKKDLEAIKRRAEAATPGPWGAGANLSDGGDEYDVFGPNPKKGPAFIANYAKKQDAKFIAHAREDVPALVAEVERLSELLQRAKRRLNFYSPLCREIRKVLGESVLGEPNGRPA